MLLALSSIVLLSIVVLCLSKCLAYFHTGAHQVNKYDLGLNQLKDHNPELSWLEDDKDIKGEINPFIRKEIEEAYKDAWGILNLSTKNQTDLGLEENFTKTKAEQIRSNFNERSGLQKEDLSHLLKLHFISLDKQVVAFSDKKMLSQIKSTASTNVVLYKDTSSYKVVMTLNDGKWRVNKLHRY